MDIAYDHIQEESFPQDAPQGEKEKENPNNLNTEFQEAYKAISNSPWGARLGGLWGTVKKQGEQYLEGASEQATKGFTDLRSTIASRTRSLSLSPTEESSDAAREQTGEASASDSTATDGHPDRPESLPADIVKEAESMLSRFRSEASKRLKDIEKAEDAADEALLRFGTNIRNFLSDAVTIAPPSEATTDADGKAQVLFESKDASGRRVIHTTRFDAQLHVIHTRLESFLQDPESPEYEPWSNDFDVEKRTEDIAKDLDKYEELRHAMEKLVPEKVEYAQFWKRYYFMRHVVETEEQKRRELLKGAASNPDEEEVGWDEDSEDDSSTPHPNNASTSTLTKPAPAAPSTTDAERLKPGEPRRSNDLQSQADSDASYDLVSGATSKTPSSPKDAAGKVESVAEESDEDDWE